MDGSRDTVTEKRAAGRRRQDFSEASAKEARVASYPGIISPTPHLEPAAALSSVRTTNTDTTLSVSLASIKVSRGSISISRM